MPEETTDSDPSQELIRHVDVEEETYAPIEEKKTFACKAVGGTPQIPQLPAVSPQVTVTTGHHHNQTTPTVVDIKLRQLHHVMVIES